MSDWVYRGLTTKRLYRFMGNPKLAADTLGRVTIQGELAVLVNRDGAIQRGVLGTSDDTYSPGWTQSTWEES